jgi:hypothetical protein
MLSFLQLPKNQCYPILFYEESHSNVADDWGLLQILLKTGDKVAVHKNNVSAKFDTQYVPVAKYSTTSPFSILQIPFS